MDLLSDISDFLGVLRNMPEITTGVFLDREISKYDQQIVQICRLICTFKFVKKCSICDWMQVQCGSKYEPEEVY